MTPSLSTHALSLLTTAGTCDVSDALDTLGRNHVLTGIKQLGPDRGIAIVGLARTVTLEPLDGDSTQKCELFDPALFDRLQDGDVIIVAARQRFDLACWGGKLSARAAARGVRCVVVDGAVRDLNESASVGVAQFALGVTPRSCRGHLRQTRLDHPIDIGGVIVAAGDVVVADSNGVAVISQDDLRAVLATLQ